MPLSLVSESDDDQSLPQRVSDFAELAPEWQTKSGSLDHLATELQSLAPGNTIEQMLRMGELVHRTLQRGDKSSEKSTRASLRRIAAHPRVPFKLTTLWRAMSVYEMSLQLPQLIDGEGLGISHLRAVIGLEPAEQQTLLSRASAEGWTKRRLEREAARCREGRKRRGRPPTPEVMLWARKLQRLIARGEELEDALARLNNASREELLGVLSYLETKIRDIRAKIS